MPDLCQLADLKAWLNIPSAQTTDDTQLSRLITAVSAEFLNEIDRVDLTPAVAYTDVHQITRKSLRVPNQAGEVYSGRGNLRIGLRHWPVNSITSASLDGNALSASPDGVQNGYFIDSSEDPEYRDTLQLIDIPTQYWSSMLSVVYNAGYATVPKDIEQAAIEWAGFRYRSKQWIGQTSKHLSTGETVSIQQGRLPASVQAVIDLYKRPVSVL